jgi:hypothetical protein
MKVGAIWISFPSLFKWKRASKSLDLRTPAKFGRNMQKGWTSMLSKVRGQWGGWESRLYKGPTPPSDPGSN